MRFKFPSFKLSRFWSAWFILMLFILFIHCLTLSISPPIWQDEVQIIEFGRTTIDPSTDWSINWNVANGSPVLNPIYLGSVIQNLAFTFSGYNIIFPRLLSLLGSIAASTSCLLLLLSYGHNHIRSAALSTTLLLDPIFVSGYRGDRIDCWVITSAFISCYLLQKNANRSFSLYKSYSFVICAGAVSAAGISLWISFGLLAPLVIWQITSGVSEGRFSSIGAKRNILFKIFSLWVLSFAICVLLIQLPILIGKTGAYSDLILAISRFVNSQGMSSSITTFITTFFKNPFLLVLAIIFIFLRPRLDLLFFMAIALAMILRSTVYAHRVVYILPYLVVFCSLSMHRFIQREKPNTTFFWILKGIRSLLWSGLAASVFVSLVLRPINAMVSKNVRQPLLIEQVAVHAVGHGDFKVFIEPWEFYVPGRKLDWKMYKPYFGDFRLSDMSQMDYVVLSGKSDLTAKVSRLRFELVGEYLTKSPSLSSFTRNFFSTGYGPYTVYKNPRI